MLAKVLALASVLATASALPNVTISQLPLGCASYPLYDANTGNAGPWSAELYTPDNADLVGTGISNIYSVAYSPSTGPVMRWGYLTANYRTGIARNALQCIDDKLNIYTESSLNAAGAPQNYKWLPLALSSYPYDALVLYYVDGVQPGLYEHYVNGTKQSGSFLGGFNTTTWGVKWYAAGQGTRGFPYFNLRLLPDGQALLANETRTFVRIQA